MMRRDKPMATTLLTPEEAANQLGTSIRFVRRLVAERRIPFFHIGKHVRFLSTDIEEFIAAGRVGAIPMRAQRR
jgi:excisionase family DNA binding protein